MKQNADSTAWSGFAELQRKLIRSMSEQQRAAYGRPWDDPKRLWWTYLPRPRAGLTLGELDRPQRKLVHRLLSQVLSDSGYAQVALIMALEDVLDREEGWRRDRHSSDFWAVMFGDGPDGDRWSWRFEGHHVSVNVTAVDGRFLVAPCFLGAHPARLGRDRNQLAAPFGTEEALAFELMSAMGPASRERALVADGAPDDIYSGTAATCEAAILPAGIAASDLNATAESILDRLVGVYLRRFSLPVRTQQMSDLAAGPLFFAWEGALARSEPHYYRIQGRDMIIEYDNSSHRANHVHSVWRRPSSDFGRSLLKDHLSEGHGQAAPARPDTTPAAGAHG